MKTPSPVLRPMVPWLQFFLSLCVVVSDCERQLSDSGFNIRMRVGGNGGHAIRIGTTLSSIGTTLSINSPDAMFQQAYEMFFIHLEKSRTTEGGRRNGIRLGGHLRPLELVVMQASTEEEVYAAYKEMSDNGINLFLQPSYNHLLNSAYNGANGSVNHSNSVFMSPMSSNPNHYMGRDNQFGVVSNGDMRFAEILTTLAPRISSLATIKYKRWFCPNKQVREWAANLNITVKHENFDFASFSRTKTNLSIGMVMEKLARDPPDAVFGCMNKRFCSEFVRSMKHYMFAPKALIMDECQTHTDVMAEMGGMAEFMIGVQRWTPTPDNATYEGISGEEFSEQFESRYRVPPRHDVAMAWAAITSLVAAVEAANSTNATEVISQLRDMELKTLAGVVKFGPSGIGAMDWMGVQVNKDQSVKRVSGDGFSGNMVYPMPMWEERECNTLDADFHTLFGWVNGSCQSCGRQSRSLVIMTRNNGNLVSKRVCQECPTGTFAFALETHVSCVECPSGSYTNLTGRTRCEHCGAGLYQNESGQTRCKQCSAGRQSWKASANSCSDCGSGRFARAVGSSACARCAVGKFQSSTRGSSCSPCGARKTTMQRSIMGGSLLWVLRDGAANPSWCGCEPGTRQHSSAAGACLDCEEGLQCVGMDDVLVKPGYMARSVKDDDAISVFHCFGDTNRCPGGTPGKSCANGRTGNACALCEAKLTPGENGECVACGEGHAAPFIAVTFAAILSVGSVYVFMAKYGLENKNLSVLVGAVLGLLVTQAQQFGVIANLSLFFQQPLQSFFEIISLFSFDIAILRPGCIVEGIDELSMFLMQVSIMYFGMILLAFLHSVWVLMSQNIRHEKKTHALIKSAGMLVLVFYISVIKSVMSPLHCAPHPNGKLTMRSLQSVECWSDDRLSKHMIMTISSVPFSLAPLGFFALSIWVVLKFPMRIRKGDTTFLKQFGFFFIRYHPEKYWFILVTMFRSLLFGLVPVLPGPMVQLIGMQLVLILYYSILLFAFPWRTRALNAIDSCFTVITLIVVYCCAFSAEIENLSSVGFVCIVFVIVAVACTCLVLCYNFAHDLLRKIRKLFDVFLCHHKAGTGCCARLLKMYFQESGCASFIDSDDLQNLDKLFAYVSDDSKAVLVFCSKEILLRPWCMGEIVTAKINEVNTVKLVFSSFEEPTRLFINTYHDHVDLSGLAARHISLSMIREAMPWLAKQPRIDMPSSLTRKKLQQLFKAFTSDEFLDSKLSVISDELDGPSSRTTSGSSLSSKDSRNRGMANTFSIPPSLEYGNWANVSLEEHASTSISIVLADHSDLEAQACAQIVVMLVLPLMVDDLDFTPRVLPPQIDLPPSAQLVIIICTNNAFRKKNMLRALLAAGRQKCMHIPLLADEHFRFPTTEFVEENRDAVAAVTNDHDALLNLIRDVFKTIAIVFQPQHYSSTEGVLCTKAQEIASRMRNTGALVRLAWRPEDLTNSKNTEEHIHSIGVNEYEELQRLNGSASLPDANEAVVWATSTRPKNASETSRTKSSSSPEIDVSLHEIVAKDRTCFQIIHGTADVPAVKRHVEFSL